jgi:hypothetical protein
MRAIGSGRCEDLARGADETVISLVDPPSHLDRQPVVIDPHCPQQIANLLRAPSQIKAPVNQFGDHPARRFENIPHGKDGALPDAIESTECNLQAPSRPVSTERMGAREHRPADRLGPAIGSEAVDQVPHQLISFRQVALQVFKKIVIFCHLCGDMCGLFGRLVWHSRLHFPLQTASVQWFVYI